MRRPMIPAQSGWLAACLLVVLALLASAPGTGAAGVPGGNNGTVKIHEGATETEPIVRNEPHVCTFHLHFFFADPSQSGSWEIQTWSPGDSGTVALSGSYDTTGDGEDRQPATDAFSLPDGHYKLFWQGRNEQNVKHKVFWVECPAVPAESVIPSGSVTPSESVIPSESLNPTGSELPASSESHGAPTGGVEAATGVPGATPPATDVASDAGSQQGTAAILLALAGIAAAALALTPRDVLRRRRSG